MSVPFSNTHLRVPRGFGTILEGLAREILRDQPEDIPKYAAQYFDALLKRREESGMDPAEWAAKLEDRFYNNHAFKATVEQNQPTASPEEELATEVNISKEKSYESQTEDESSPSAEALNLSTTQFNVSEEVVLTESTGEEEEEEELDITEKYISTEKRLSEEELVTRLPAAGLQLDDLSKKEEEKHPVIATCDEVDGAANENDSSSVPDQDPLQSKPTDMLSFQGISNVDVCAQELASAEDEGGDKQESAIFKEDIEDTGRENTEAEEQVEVFPYSGLADVNVCAQELGSLEDEGGDEQETAVVEEKNLDLRREKTEAEEQVEVFPYSGLADVDVCAQELGGAEDEGEDKRETVVVEEKNLDLRQEKTEAEEPVEGFSYSGLAHVDVCAAGLVGAESTLEEATAEDTQVNGKESSKIQPEETVVQSPSSRSETPEADQQVAEDKSEITTEMEGTETEGIYESLTNTEGGLDNNVIPQEDSLAEISFEDVPEVQRIKEAVEKQPEEKDSEAVRQTETLKLQEEEEYQEVTRVATEQKKPHTQDTDEAEMVGVENKVNSQGEKRESQHEVSDIMKERMETNDSNLSVGEKDVETISSSNQPTSEAVEENPENETNDRNDNTETINEGELHRNDPNEPDFSEDKTRDMVGGDEEDMHTEGYSEVEDQEINDGGAENHSSQVTVSNMSSAAKEAGSETSVPQHLSPEEDEESQRTLVEPQPEDTVVEKELTLMERASETEGVVEKGETDCEIQEKSDAMCVESSVSNAQSADWPTLDHQGEERPLASEMDATEAESSSDDKQEDCSRPQEEEDIMDIPLDDPEANRAAAKIQAGFRGHMTRKKMKPEDKAEGEEVSSTGDVLNGSQGDTETGGSRPVEGEDTSVPEQ